MVEQLASDTGLWGWIRNLAEANMLAFIIVIALFLIFTVVAFAVGLNLIGTHVLGRQDKVVPVLLKWIGRRIVRWIPVISSRIKLFLTQSDTVKRPMTVKRKILASIGIAIYFVVMLGVLFSFSLPSVSVRAFSVDGGGVLIEYHSYLHTSDGFKFDVTFNQPAKISDIGYGIPTKTMEHQQLTYNTTPVINFVDNQESNSHNVTASYPISSTKRSVYVYFQSSSNSTQPLDVLSLKAFER